MYVATLGWPYSCECLGVTPAYPLFYGYGRDLMDGFTFGLQMFTPDIWLAHYAGENWSWSEPRIDS